jgi:hypothetical protein
MVPGGGTVKHHSEFGIDDWIETRYRLEPMTATTLTGLALLVGLLGGMVYWWGERSAFSWMRFGAAAVIVLAIGVAAATWPDHHVVATAGAINSDGSSDGGIPSLSPSSTAPGANGSSLSQSSRLSNPLAPSPTESFSGSIVILTGGGGYTPSPSPQPTKPGHTPTPTPTTPSPSPTETTPSPSPTETTPSPSPTETTPSPSPTETTPSPSPTESTPSPSPTESTPSPSPTEPSPSPTMAPSPGSTATPGFRL